MNAKKLIAPLAAAAALALAGVPAASAQEQQAMSPELQYAYTCGHLGSSCDDGESARPKRARRTCSKRTRGSKSRRRCARPRRAGARR